MKRPLLMAILFSLLCLLAAPAMADEPRWRDVPSHLKNADGVELQGDFVFATGMALAANNVRPGKVAEVARKKSFFRALQGLRLAVSCPELISLASPVHLERVTVIRQWESARIHFTTVAAPLSALEDLACEFPNLSTAISRFYFEQEAGCRE